MNRIYGLSKILATALFLVALVGLTAPAAAVSADVYPDHDNYWTGRVMSSSGGYQKHNADIMYGKDPPDDKWQGFAKFNLADIPDNSTIVSASFFYYVVSQHDDPATDVTLVTVDPVTAEPQPLWNAIVGGAVVSPELVTDRGWAERPLNAAGVAALQNALDDDWLALGLHKTVDDGARGHAKGYEADRFRPYIHVEFAAADMGVDLIDAPTGQIPASTDVAPRVTVSNYGDIDVPFDLTVIIYDGSTELYKRTVTVAGVPVGGTAVVPMPAWTADAVGGERSVSAEITLNYDANPANNFALAWFEVTVGGGDDGGNPNPYVWWGWVEGRPLPVMPSVRNIKAGGALAVDPATGTVYGTRGNRTPDFFAYDPVSGKWNQLAPVPGFKAPGRGASATADGKGSVYFAKGNKTSEFWRYDIAANQWERLPDIPADMNGRPIRNGVSLVAMHQYGLEYVYAQKAMTGELVRYSTAARAWASFGLPVDGVETRWQRGSWLAASPDGHLYALKAKYNQLMAFDYRNEVWDGLRASMPFWGSTGRSKRAGLGGGGAWKDEALYALKGGKTQEFWKYDPTANSWVEYEPMPALGSSMKMKKTGQGGAFAAYPFGRVLFGFKGNNTREFWRYFMPPTGQGDGVQANPVVGVSESNGAAVGQMSIGPNPARNMQTALAYAVPKAGRATVSIYDASGRLAQRTVRDLGRSGRLDLDLSGLGAGSYIVQLDGPGYHLKGRVVMAR